jgi:hypothetical protein
MEQVQWMMMELEASHFLPAAGFHTITKHLLLTTQKCLFLRDTVHTMQNFKLIMIPGTQIYLNIQHDKIISAILEYIRF